MWRAGTLCITIAANIAKTAILTFDACFPDSVVGLVPGKRLTTEYIRYWFVGVEKAIDAAAPQVAQKNINLEILRTLDIQLPPRETQNEFSQWVGHIREIQERLRNAAQEAEDLLKSLVQRAFTGEL